MQKGVKAKPYYIKELDIWQLFIFLSAPTSTLKATAAVNDWLSSAWFSLDSDSVDVLPNGSPMSIPLQAGFTWLNDEYQAILSASEISLENAASMFLHDLVDCANTLETITLLTDNADQIDQPAYAEKNCRNVEPTAIEQQVVDLDSSNNDGAVLEYIDLVFPIIASIKERDQPERLLEPAYADKDETTASFDEVIVDLQETLVESPDHDIDQAAYAGNEHLSETALSVVENPSSSAHAPPSYSQPDKSAKVPLDLEQTNLFALKEAAYAADLNKNPAEKHSKVTAPIGTRATTRDAPLAKQKSRPTIRSNLDSFEQLKLPFGSNTS